MANHKMPRRLVALSSSAIAAIYFAGLVSTHGADASLAAAAVTATPAISATSTPTTAPVLVNTAASTYADGSYTGTGTSRRGDITVTVTVAAGRITNVA